MYPQLAPVIGAPWGYCGRGFLLPVHYGSVGEQLTRLRRLNQGTLTSLCVRKNLNATVLQVTCTRDFFFYSYTGISRRGKTCQYSTAVVVLIFCIWTYFIPIVGVGKERHTIIIGLSMVMQSKGGTRYSNYLEDYTGPVPADSRQ